jgi:capsular exopolysaccharide synthesis family protein
MQNQEKEIHLLDYWRILQKRRRVALSFFAIVVGIVVVYSFVATPIYKGTAQVLIDLEKNPTMTFSEGGGAFIQMRDASEYYRTQTEILSSRAFGDRVVRKLQLETNPYFLEKKGKGSFSPLKLIKQFVFRMFPSREKPANPIPLTVIQDEADAEMTDMVLNNTEVEIGKGTNILKINYLSENPLVAAAMANGIASTYIEHNLDIRVKPFRDAVEWLSARTMESRSKVEDSEKVVQKYKEGQGIVSFESKENVITQKLQEITTQLVQAESKRQEAEVRYKQIKSVINNVEMLATVPDIMNNPVIQALRTDELAVKRKISDLSEKFGPKHPNIVRARTELKSIQKNLIAEARKMLNAAKTDYDIARGREISLQKAIDDQKKEVLDLGRKSIDYGVIAGEAASNKQFYELLLKKLQEASLSSGINVSNAQVVDGATMPTSPFKPRRMLNILLSALVGLLGGVFAAFFVEYMDDTIKTPDDIEKLLTIPFLGYIPTTNKEEGPIYMFSGPRANIAESYRSIRTSIMLSSTEDDPLRVLLITSTTPNEGKTTTAANLAIAMAQLGERVLLIDTDMRRHNLHKVFGLDNLIGISDMIIDHNNAAAAIRPVSAVPNLSVITGGTLAPNPSELLGSNSMRLLISKLRAQYDRIILDSPPIMVFSDGLVLSRIADGVVFVVWGGTTGRDNIKKSVQAIAGVNSRILGIVLNNIDLTSKNAYYYYHPYYNYHYDYGEKDAEKKADKRTS